MKIGGLQKTSLLEYPGRLCAVVFTRGCNLRCPYCHNPELVLPNRYTPLIPQEKVLAFLQSRRKYLNAVAVTGGEPCLQRGLLGFLRAVRHLGYSLKLDTNGCFPEVLAALLEEGLLDYISMDIKAPLAKYEQTAAAPVDRSGIRKSISLVLKSGVDHEFRTTVVASQLTGADLESIGRLINGARRYFLQKFVPSKTVNEDFLREKTYSAAEFDKFRRAMHPYVKECRVR